MDFIFRAVLKLQQNMQQVHICPLTPTYMQSPTSTSHTTVGHLLQSMNQH